MNDAAAIGSRIAELRQRIASAARRSGRPPESIRLVGVCKRKSAALAALAARAGLGDLAENYVQEARDKIPAVAAELAAGGLPPPRWHFIGRLQGNKAREAVRLFDVIETLDRPELGAELDRRAAGRARPLPVLLQINVSGEAQKGGASPADAPALLAASRAWSHLEVVGLMAIPAPAESPEASRPAFARLRTLRDELRSRPGGDVLRELSMGMSGDFEVAIEEGATWVRIGTAIFGVRAPAAPE